MRVCELFCTDTHNRKHEAPLAVTAKRRKPSLSLPDPPKGIGEDLLSLKNADIGYDDAILKNINLTINRGIKLIIRGPNGGKR